MNHIGIDPGKLGGLVWIGDENFGPYVGGRKPKTTIEIDYTPMPGTRKDVWQWIHDHNGATHAMIEQLQYYPLKPKPGHEDEPPPRQSPKSLMTFGQGYGELLGMLTAADISTEEIPPKQWQKGVGMFHKKNESQPQWKNRLRARAQELFPSLPIWSEPRTKGKQLAIADALLIAWWCRRVNH